MESPQEQGGDIVRQRTADMQKGTLEVPIQESVTNSTNLRSTQEAEPKARLTTKAPTMQPTWGYTHGVPGGAWRPQMKVVWKIITY